MRYEEILSHFPTKQKRSGPYKAVACCPAHMDATPSLSIDYNAESKKTLVKCFAGCETEEVLSAVGLTVSDLFDDEKTPERDPVREYEKFVLGSHADLKKLVTVYDYYTQDGEYAFSRSRFLKTDGTKQMLYALRILNQDGTEWIRAKVGKKISSFGPCYYSPDLCLVKDAIREGTKIFYTEGEKDADTVSRMGLPAITCGGAEDWRDDCKTIFSGADLVILADNDEPGRKLARQIRDSLNGTAKRIRIVTPCADIDKGDITDFVDHGGTRAQLLNMVEAAKDEMPLDKFHTIDAKGKASGVFDAAIFEYIKSTEQIRIIGGIPFIYRNGIFRADSSGATLKTKIRRLIYPEFVKAPTIKRIYDLFISDAELQSEPEEMDRYPAHWICFQDGMYDPITRKMHPHSPKYLAMHQIPHDFPKNPGEGSTIRKWLEFIAPPEDIKMLLQFAGYCMTRDMRQQKMLVLCGEGGTGKSLVIRLIEKMVGPENRSSISIDQFSQRFASFGLFGKILNSCADLKIKALEDTSTIKQIIGEDTIRGEAKGKDAISFQSCAKVIFSINQLPPVRDEKTEGFYRRLLILPMNRKPDQVDTDLFRKLSDELDAFMSLALEALSDMYAIGTIAESERSKRAVRDWRKKSDTITAFIDDCTERDPNAIVKRSDFRRAYEDYCSTNERIAHKKSVFFDALQDRGINCRDYLMHGEYMIKGYRLLPVTVDF